MKFYQVFDPYYALIKATSKESAYKIYVDNVADDMDDTLIDEIEEISRDEAVVLYTRSALLSDPDEPVLMIVSDIQKDEEEVLLYDGSLL